MNNTEDDYLEFDQMMGMAPTPAATPELQLYNEITSEGKYKAIYNHLHWLKHELYVYTHIKSKGWSIYQPHANTLKAVQFKDVARGLMEYYYLMNMHSRFHSERAAQMGKQVDLQKFLDLVMEHPDVKKLIANPHDLV